MANQRVESIYRRLAPVYDLIYGATLEPGRRHAMNRLAPAGGERILEIGVGTGLSAMAYPPGCRVAAIDVSAPMLKRAQTRLDRRRPGQITLLRMDAARLGFRDGSFDAVYAPYVMNVVPDPVAVAREMLRVCRADGRLVLLNHFADRAPSWTTDLLGKMAAHAGVNWKLDLHDFLLDAGLVARSVERVNVPSVSSVVICHKARMVHQTRRV